MKRNLTKPGAAAHAPLPSPFDDPKTRERLLETLRSRLDQLSRLWSPGVATFKELVASDPWVKTLARRRATEVESSGDRASIDELYDYVLAARRGQ